MKKLNLKVGDIIRILRKPTDWSDRCFSPPYEDYEPVNLIYPVVGKVKIVKEINCAADLIYGPAYAIEINGHLYGFNEHGLTNKVIKFNRATIINNF